MTELIPANSSEGREWRICDIQQGYPHIITPPGCKPLNLVANNAPDMPVDNDNDLPQVMNDIMKHFISGAHVVDIINPEEFKK